MCWRSLQPHVTEPATVRGGACILQPYAYVKVRRIALESPLPAELAATVAHGGNAKLL